MHIIYSIAHKTLHTLSTARDQYYKFHPEYSAQNVTICCTKEQLRTHIMQYTKGTGRYGALFIFELMHKMGVFFQPNRP